MKKKKFASNEELLDLKLSVNEAINTSIGVLRMKQKLFEMSWQLDDTSYSILYELLDRTQHELDNDAKNMMNKFRTNTFINDGSEEDYGE